MFWANLILATKVKRKLIYLHSDIKADMEKLTVLKYIIKI